jgi:hypothetical protein
LTSFRPKRLLGISALVLLGSGALYICLALVGLAPGPGTNISETNLELKNLSGADFEVIETDSDTLAKEQFVSVYVCDPVSRSNWLSRLTHRKELLFRYDPWNWDEPMPMIEMTKPGRVQISIGRVSEIIYQRHEWKKLSVDYKIGFVKYH